ncbi:MAG: 3-dehydroquinate synthase, partial [Leuconostoc sp.]|nr:3-dehydroquinate synthase [Leuconostoc sp.]
GTTDFFNHLINDKKNHDGVLNLVALEKVGQPIIVKKKIADMPAFVEN